MYIKVRGELINLDSIKFVRYDNLKILLYIDDIFNLSYIIDSAKTGYDEEKKVIWFNYMKDRIENYLGIMDLDKIFDDDWGDIEKKEVEDDDDIIDDIEIE